MSWGNVACPLTAAPARRYADDDLDWLVGERGCGILRQRGCCEKERGRNQNEKCTHAVLLARPQLRDPGELFSRQLETEQPDCISAEDIAFRLLIQKGQIVDCRGEAETPGGM